jgi:hypothetical protein
VLEVDTAEKPDAGIVIGDDDSRPPGFHRAPL